MASIQFDLTDDEMTKKLWRLTAEIAIEKGGRVGIGTAAAFVLETVLTNPKLFEQVLAELEHSTIHPASGTHAKKRTR